MFCLHCAIHNNRLMGVRSRQPRAHIASQALPAFNTQDAVVACEKALYIASARIRTRRPTDCFVCVNFGKVWTALRQGSYQARPLHDCLSSVLLRCAACPRGPRRAVDLRLLAATTPLGLRPPHSARRHRSRRVGSLCTTTSTATASTCTRWCPSPRRMMRVCCSWSLSCVRVRWRRTWSWYVSCYCCWSGDQESSHAVT